LRGNLKGDAMTCCFLPIVLAHEGAASNWTSLPFHPIFVNFTAALLPASFLFDLLAAWSKKDALRAAAWYTLLLAAIVTPITAAAGWLWMHSMGDMMDQWQMPIHKWLGTGAAALVILYAIWRGRLYSRGRSPGLLYALAALVLFAALLFQGDLGGSMSFGRGIVIPSEAK
jgi:uncharacterized membrane protein